MTVITRIGTVTDTDQREILVVADSAHVRLEVPGDLNYLTVRDANKLCHHLIKAMNTAIAQGADLNG